MKQDTYTKPEIEIISIEVETVIALSGAGSDDIEYNPNDQIPGQGRTPNYRRPWGSYRQGEE